MKKDPGKTGKDRLVYTDDWEQLIRMAREKGLRDEDIILRITEGETYEGCLAIAQKHAHLFGVKVQEFMVIARRRKP